jgi:hypothetical protein
MANYLFPDAFPRIHASLNANSKEKDIVIVLGWGGGKQKNLKKLVNFYQSKDISVITSIMPQFVPTFVRSYYEREIALSVKKIRARDHVLGKSKLSAHIFSNNGTWAFSTLSRRSDLPSFDKLVIDSAPAFYYKRISVPSEVNLLSRVITSVILQRPQYEHLISIPVKAVLYVFIPTWRLTNFVQSCFGVDILPDYRELSCHMRDKSPQVPTLFIYSIGDNLVPFERVKEFKNSLKDRGVPTTDLVFGVEVPHTAAFFKYPDEYIEVLDKHLELKKLPDVEKPSTCDIGI